MQKLHESAQSQLFELRTQSGLFPTSVIMIIFVTYILKVIVNWSISFFSPEEDRAAKEVEVSLLMDEVERAQARLVSLEREKVALWFEIPV
jgi:homeobox protein cut-like